MKVLKISLDVQMLRQEQIDNNDSLQRRILLAKELESLHAIVFSTQTMQNPFVPVENLFIYSTNSRNKLARVFDALKIGHKLCQEHKFDLITTQDPFFTGFVGVRLAKKYNIPLNVQMHTNFIDNKYWLRERPLNHIMNWMGKRALKKTDSFRVVAGSEKKRLVQMGYPADKIGVIAESIFIDKLLNADGSAIRAQYQNQGYDKILLCPGRLVKQKNLPMLIHAFRQILQKFPNALLLIIGNGSETTTINKLSAELHISKNVMVLPAIPFAQLPAYYDAADVLVVSSWHEGGPRTIKEAAVIGIPIVSTAVGVVDEVVDAGENGYIVAINDTQAFADAVINVLNDQNIRDRCKKRVQQSIEEFGRHKHISGVVELWKNTVEQCNG